MNIDFSSQLKKEEILDGLNDSEKSIVISILDEYSKKGYSEKYNDLLYSDYREIPVDIETFLTDDRYLGNSWKDKEGNLKLYPYWLDVLKDIFPTNVDTNYDTLLESGARGIGKSEVACSAICPYLMYRILCMKDPRDFFRIKQNESIAFAFLNIKLELVESISVAKFQGTVQASPWFMSMGTMSRRNNKPYWIPPDPIKMIIGSQSDDVIGLPIYFCFVDEISFLKNKDVNEQKRKAKDMIDTAKGGMKTRFIHNGKNPTLMVVASSKRSEQSFMETYIRELGQDENVKIVDKAVWEIKPKGTYSDKTFYVGLGNKHLDNIVIPKSDYNNLKMYQEKGYNIIEMPIDFEKDARIGLEKVLCDYAGISSFSSNKFLSSSRVSEVVLDTIHNPLPDIIKCGDARDDLSQYKDWFDMDKLNKKYLTKPLFIHLDMSTSGDKTGIAGVWIVGKKPNEDGTPSKDLVFELAFSTSVEAPTGRHINFAKTREFIRWLKNVVQLKIKKITYDTYQSFDTGQQLQSEGFETEVLSVDRVETVQGTNIGICKPYQHLKNVIYENRIRLYDTELLYNELVQLEINNTNGKVDHPDKGSKDQADALCGATYTASKYADQYSFDYGDNLEQVIEINQDIDSTMKQQITTNFEAELKKAFANQQQSRQPNNSQSVYLPNSDILVF